MNEFYSILGNVWIKKYFEKSILNTVAYLQYTFTIEKKVFKIPKYKILNSEYFKY